MEATVGSIVINDMLPEDMRDYNRVLDKKNTGKLLTDLAKRYPDLYKDISHKMLQFGYQSAYLTGGQSFGLKDVSEASVVPELRKKIESDVQNILEKWYNKGVDSDDPRVTKEVVGAIAKYHKIMVDSTMDERRQQNSPFYRQAAGTGAQKGTSFNSIIGADLLYEDQDNNPVPVPVTHGYSRGLTPVQYFAGSFGGRKGVVDLQAATANAGFLAKQLVQIAHREVCVGDDAPDPYDEGRPIGLPVDTLDPDNEGSYLAHPVGGYKRNTLLTPKILRELHQKGHDSILVRSVTVGGPNNGGIYAYDAGVREHGRRPATGEFVGIAAVQSISEPITQIAISSKHSGGVAGADSAKTITGFNVINQMIQVPKKFKHGAAHSTVDGRVDRIDEAPQGGMYVYISGKKHYVPRDQGREVPVTVKVGQEVEAGDVISEGLPNPAVIVKYKGIGEGRRSFTNQFMKVLKDSGVTNHRRNVEALSRGFINYVRLNDNFGDYVAEDIIPYTMIAADYKPRPGCQENTPKSCKGMYLEKPVLHYTIGTRITPSVVKTLDKYNVKNIICHKEPPPFEPEVVRGMAHASKDPDWGTRLIGGYNKSSLLDAVWRGGTSNTEGTSYAPALALGTPDFGRVGALASDENRIYR